VAGERFAVRNSGAVAVVEGVGDHGCEYMTGGLVVVLGEVGRNFAAGMSGGVAWVWDPDARLDALCNRAGVVLEPVEDAEALRTLIERHRALTGSARAAALLADWPAALRRFVQVMPTDYRRALAALEAAA
jgi:glutamate synthase domain-containing protein 3